MVVIQKLGKGKCQMSGKEAEGVVCKFGNGFFEGFLSWPSFKQMCRLMSAQPAKEAS